MKLFILGFTALLATCSVLAAEPVIHDQTGFFVHLDVAKVLSMSSIPEVCEVVPVKMEYEDSQGQRHILNYHVMGNGCSNG